MIQKDKGQTTPKKGSHSYSNKYYQKVIHIEFMNKYDSMKDDNNNKVKTNILDTNKV